MYGCVETCYPVCIYIYVSYTQREREQIDFVFIANSIAFCEDLQIYGISFVIDSLITDCGVSLP